MGEAKRRLAAGDEKRETPKTRAVTVNFPIQEWERLERIRQGIRLSRHAGGTEPDPGPPAQEDFIVLLVARMLDNLVRAAVEEENRRKKEKLVQIPKLVMTPGEALAAERPFQPNVEM